jgi:pimeloyl-ACP methyl ester carboxylesterase/DNA-binding CsgD family transcriptional regulator
MRQPSPEPAGSGRDVEPRRQIRFCALPGGARVAYATVGRGPALVLPAAWISHLELQWQDPAIRGFMLALARHRMVVQYDRPGCGLSDASPERQTLDTSVALLRGIVDHLELDRFDLLGISEAGAVSLAFAARHPDRVAGLVVYGGYADGRQIATPDVRTAMIGMVRAHWGLGSDVLADVFLPDASAETKAHFARQQRHSTTAEFASRLLAQCYELRVDDLLDEVKAPALVLHRRDDRAIPYRLGRDLAARVPGARLVSLPGRSHFPYAGDAASVVRAILEFLGETAPAVPAGLPLSLPLPLPLTPRQLEVAALVAAGRTNREIAQRLGIEERSAEGHVERIRRRLGVTSRAQIAAWWARGGHGDSPLPRATPR